MFGHVRLKPDTMVACNRQIGSLLNVMYPPPYGRQCATAWWPIRKYKFLLTNKYGSAKIIQEQEQEQEQEQRMNNIF
nr:MAG TPA: hypothetical protein [Caudoviricetes sp.]